MSAWPRSRRDPRARAEEVRETSGSVPRHGSTRMTRRPRLRKAGRIAAYAGAGLVALAAVIAVGAPIYFSGERFGRLVERVLPEMSGHIHIGGGHWSWATVVALVRSRPAALSFQEIAMTDPEGTEV